MTGALPLVARFWPVAPILLAALVSAPPVMRAQDRDRPGRGAARTAPAPESEDDRPQFLRLSRDDGGQPQSLDTSIVQYHGHSERGTRRGREALQVDLVAAVHLGGDDYYETLNRLFTEYDAVLYELVAPPNARVPKPGRKPSGAIGSAQQGLTRLLGLEFQLDRVDYAANNFVHADLSPQQFDAAMAKRGETWWSMFTRLMRESMARAEPGRGGDVGVGDLFGLLFGSEDGRQVRLRRLMAEQFTDMDVLTAAFGGEEGSTLITDRNAAALAVLRDEVGKGSRRIAIFYGAAHMDDFDQRLQADFGLQPGETLWLEAWDLREPAGRR
ncbi:MAG: hypothetical protein DWI03_05000 [Planctomycetota bacterium]|nr:MAG: hypothetical protein DWI03_05000 [Planctomycetota bacterium]